MMRLARPYRTRHTAEYGNLVLILVLLWALSGWSAAQADLTSYTVPGESVYPECVAFDGDRDMFWTASTTDGAIYEAETGAEEMTTFLGGDEVAFASAYGLAISVQDRLWVVGGPSGRIAVYDTWTGNVQADLATPEADATFLNDVVVAPDGNAYVTDSFRPVLFRVPASASGIGEPEAWLDLTQTPIEYTSGETTLESVNLNGIVATEDGSYLLTVQMNQGRLFRISLEDKSVTEIDVGDEDLTNGDGLVLDGRTLYLVRIANNEVVTLELDESYESATVTNRLNHDAFVFPACAALAGDTLLVVNTQFNRQGEGVSPELPFEVLGVPLSLVQPQEMGGDGDDGEGSDDGAATDAEATRAGWFPQAQVVDGREAYQSSCASCHGNDLTGVPGAAPSIHGEIFMGRFGDGPVATLFNYIRNNMPLGNAGSLDSSTYADITAYILAENDFPVGGDQRLGTGSRLSQLTIAPENRR